MTLDARHREQAASFGAAAAAYARSRPSYPAEAVDWLLPSGVERVLDLGAGTGQLTERLHARGLDVVAVEPSLGMLEQLRATLPQVPTYEGSAERIPLPDSSVDAVLVAQAWHWVDTTRAVPEVARVLRPGGQLGLVWNLRDERHDWVAQLGRLMHHGDEQEMNADAPTVGLPFEPIERHDVAWEHVTSPERVLDLVASRSYVITLPSPEREKVIAGVTDLLRQHPDVRGRQTIMLPYVTRCTRSRLA